MEVVTFNTPEKITEQLCESLYSRYQISLETQMRGRDDIFDCVNLLYCKCHTINFEYVPSYTDSPDWIKKKKATINAKMMMINVFNAQTIASSFDEIKEIPQRVLIIKPFIKNHNWKGTNYPSKTEDWKRREKNNPTIVLNVSYFKGKRISPAYFSNIN